MRVQKALLYTLFTALLSGQGVAVVHGDEHEITIIAGTSEESLLDATVTEAKISFSLLFNTAIEKTKERFRLEVYETNEQLLNQLVAGELDAVFTNTIQYLQIKDYLNPDGSYAVQHGPNIKPKYYLLTKKSSGIETVAQLQGKIIAVPNGYAVGELFLDVLLMRHDLSTSERFFSEVRKTSDSNSSVINLFFNTVDAALVLDYAYEVASELNLQMKEQLDVIEVSQPLVHQVVSLRSDFPQQRIEFIEPYVLNMHKSPKLYETMKTFRIAAIRKVEESTLTEVQQLVSEYRRLSENQNHHE
ncbi:MAG: PhnD/SsuA/transferrin family substrate-binding protein [Candidatus Thiodiazotropha sp. (ex. Lucinisca nassula)]|nr:PhnD/SsuA/transferrin family substrate-binding protein [Candidatus Thiodiazotropha sp. (ex. Lucinisca nassula)]